MQYTTPAVKEHIMFKRLRDGIIVKTNIKLFQIVVIHIENLPEC